MKYALVALLLAASTLTLVGIPSTSTETDIETSIEVTAETEENTEADSVEAEEDEDTQEEMDVNPEEMIEDTSEDEEVVDTDEVVNSEEDETSEIETADTEADPASQVISDTDILETTPLTKYTFWYSLDKYPVYKLEAAQLVEDLMNDSMTESEACLQAIEVTSEKIYNDTINFFSEHPDAEYSEYEAWVSVTQQ